MPREGIPSVEISTPPQRKGRNQLKKTRLALRKSLRRLMRTANQGKPFDWGLVQKLPHRIASARYEERALRWIIHDLRETLLRFFPEDHEWKELVEGFQHNVKVTLGLPFVTESIAISPQQGGSAAHMAFNSLTIGDPETEPPKVEYQLHPEEYIPDPGRIQHSLVLGPDDIEREQKFHLSFKDYLIKVFQEFPYFNVVVNPDINNGWKISWGNEALLSLEILEQLKAAVLKALEQFKNEILRVILIQEEVDPFYMERFCASNGELLKKLMFEIDPDQKIVNKAVSATEYSSERKSISLSELYQQYQKIGLQAGFFRYAFHILRTKLGLEKPQSTEVEKELRSSLKILIRDLSMLQVHFPPCKNKKLTETALAA